MKFLNQVLLFVMMLSILSACTTDQNKTPFGQAKTNFAQEDYQAAFNNIQGPANAGNAEAEYALGYMYYYGKGTPLNQEKGKEWILKAAQAGNKNAQEAYQMILAHEQQIMPAAKMHQQMPMMKAPQQKTMKNATPLISTKKVMLHSHSKIVSKKSYYPYTTAEHQILAANHRHYTLQLLATHNANDAHRYIAKHKLGNNAYYFHRKLNGKDLYSVIYGDYATRTAAAQAIKTLPKSVQILKPWIRSLSSIQQQIRETKN